MIKIKVCGVTNLENMNQWIDAKPDWIGINFYKKSKRFVSPTNARAFAPLHIKKIAIFVNANLLQVLRCCRLINADIVQLHGTESPNFCASVRRMGLTVIKSIGISDQKDFEIAANYDQHVDYFLFDTKTKDFGGSSEKFDWSLLKQYLGSTPFFLSGGLDHDDVDKIRLLNHPQFYAIDINSRFEILPGIKNSTLVKTFIQTLRNV